MTKTYEVSRFLNGRSQDKSLPVEFIANLVDYEQQGSSVILRCDSLRYDPSVYNFYGTKCEVTFKPGERGSRFTVRLDFCSPEIMRIRVAQGETVPENVTPMIENGFEDQEVALSCEESQDGLVITTQAIMVNVIREPWQIVVTDLEGNRIWATKPVDIDALRRPEEQWNPPQERWLFLHRYAYPVGLQRANPYRQVSTETRAFASFELAYDEHIFGLGEDFGRLDKRNIDRELWIEEGFGNASPAAYKQVPFYMSSKGYGLFANTSNAVTYRVGSLDHTGLSIIAHDTDFLDFYFIYGPKMREILPRYTAITGQPGLPPLWSFGLWMGRITYNSQEQVEQVAQSLREHRIPCDVIHIDTGWYEEEWVCDLLFCSFRFEDPEGMLKKLHDQGFKVSLWQLPLLVIESSLFWEAAEKDYLVKRPNGKVYLSSGFLSDAGLIDYSNPEAVAWIKEKITMLFELGVDVIKVDFGEGAPPDGVYAGMPSESMHNLFPLLYNKAIFEATEDYFGKGEALIWARAAWAGSQRYPVHWSGDGIARYEDLACVLRSALSIGLSGFPFYSHDVGGFSGLPSPDLYARWIQLGAFTSHVRCHGQPPREPWEYGQQTADIFRTYMDLRYRLLPYIYSEAHDSVETSLPMVRAMVLEYQDDPTACAIEDQYLFGRSILVAPILDETGKRKVYLPEGSWFGYWDKTELQGPCWVDVDAPLDTLPLYIKAGAILPFGPEKQYTTDRPCDPLLIEIYPAQGNHEYLVQDPDVGAIPISYVFEEGTVTVNTGTAVGDIEVVLFGLPVAAAVLDGSDDLPVEDDQNQGCRIKYEGTEPHTVTFQIKIED